MFENKQKGILEEVISTSDDARVKGILEQLLNATDDLSHPACILIESINGLSELSRDIEKVGKVINERLMIGLSITDSDDADNEKKFFSTFFASCGPGAEDNKAWVELPEGGFIHKMKVYLSPPGKEKEAPITSYGSGFL